jgi:ABC-type multidrug transport system fused ATPase/permease subunit
VADNDKDPLALWRGMLSQWESSVNALANSTMKSDEYSSQMNGAMGATLRMQETIREFMAQYLAATNLPSRTEVLAIAERLGAVEARLDRITTLLEQIANAQTTAAAGAPAGTAAAAPAAAPRPRPPRTKSPPAAEPTA